MNLLFRFGAATAGAAVAAGHHAIELPNEVLHGPSEQPLASGVTPRRHAESCLALWGSADTLWGLAIEALPGGDYEAAAYQAYQRLLASVRGLHLHRAWNFLPEINGTRAGIEHYQAFCVGRGSALDATFGDTVDRHLPAATGVGTSGDRLAVVFVAGTAAPRHLENPRQVPAYRYPARYGPRAPSFARCTLITAAHGERLYISGTGAIRESESLHPSDVEAQCRVVLENVALVAGTAGLPGLDRQSPGRRAFRVYLRHPSDWPRVEALLRAELLQPEDALQAVQADICREELLMEIEACVDLPDPQASAQ